MKIQFWGVRGSIPAPGPETAAYGGNTSCVTVRAGRPEELVIIDAGTGLYGLGRQLVQGAFGKGEGRATVLLSHAHWDHIQGFPFFAPVFIPGNKFTIYGPSRSSGMLEGILEGQMNPHFSPIYTLKNMGANLEIHAVGDGQAFRSGAFKITGRLNPHGTTSALAYRLETEGRVFVYASDAGYPDEGPTPEMMELYSDADALLHDCTYTEEDWPSRRARGFSSVVQAADVAVRARVKRLVMFHYDQDYADAQVDGMVSACRRRLDENGGAGIELVAAREGEELEL